MPGLGRKTWSALEVVTAANVQGYLQDQVVQVYAGTAAAGSALGTAVSEGMIRYLSDSNEIHKYTGSSWEGIAPISGNAIINGAFDIWQRGTSFGNGVYSADRWLAYNDKPTTSQTQQTFTPGTAPVSGYESQFFFRYASTAGGSYDVVEHRVEDVRSFAGQTVTLSYWAKANANVTNSPALIQYFGTGGSANVDTYAASVTITTSWQRFTHTVTLPSIAGKTIGANNSLRLQVIRANDALAHTIDIWGVQLEAGSVATPFKRNAPSIQAELAACQRYYWRNNSPSGQSITPHGSAYSTGAVITVVTLPVEMRIVPTAVEYSGISVNDGVTAYTVSAIALLNPSGKTVSLNAYGATGLTQYRPYYLQGNSSGSYLALSAEL